MFDGGWTFLLNCCSQHSLFIVEILISEKIRISFCMTFPIFIFCYARSWWTKGKDSMRWLVSQRFQADYRFGFENEVKVYEFVLRNGYWLSTTGSLLSILDAHNAWKLLSTELLVGREWILKEVISDFCIEVVCTMRVIGLIRNFLLRRESSSFQVVQEHF